jgi:hypothetical protein
MTTIRDAPPDRWPELEALMGERGDPSRCWCQFYRLWSVTCFVVRVGHRRQGWPAS